LLKTSEGKVEFAAIYGISKLQARVGVDFFITYCILGGSVDYISHAVCFVKRRRQGQRI